MNHIFEKSHHIDRHELPINFVRVSTEAGIAVVGTRNCIGIWDLLTGKKLFYTFYKFITCFD